MPEDFLPDPYFQVYSFHYFWIACIVSCTENVNPQSGGYGGGVPPLPIPNREVKPASADGTAMQCGRVGGRILLFESKAPFMYRKRSFLRIFASDIIYLIMNALGKLFVYLGRLHHCKGFGVQSPFAFMFINDVINEHYPYYSYKQLDSLFPLLDKEKRILCRLYFRLSNYRQADIMIDYYPETNAYSESMKMGCNKMKSVTLKDKTMNMDMLSLAGIIRISLVGDYQSFFYSLMQIIESKTIIILQGINRDKETKSFWSEVCNDKLGITFDLYYAGIIVVDEERYKQNYIVNF